jgi:hypothetical protein
MMGGCFSVPWLGGVLIWLVVICGFVAIVMLILPIVLGWLGWAGDLAMRIIRIIVAVVVICALIWFLVQLYGCFVGGMPRLR